MERRKFLTGAGLAAGAATLTPQFGHAASSPGAIRTSAKTMISVSSYGAVGNGTTDDTVAIQTAATAMGNNSALYFPAGAYLISAPIVFSGSDRQVYGEGYGSVIKTNGSHSMFKLDNTNEISRFAISDLRFLATSPGAKGIEVFSTNPNSEAWFQFNKFERLHFQGTTHCIHITKTKTSFDGTYWVLNFGQCLFTGIQTSRNDSDYYPEHGIYFDGSPGSHNIFCDSTYQTTSTGIRMGNGDEKCGVGDQQIIGNSFNLSTHPIRIIGPNNLSDYRHHILISNNGFDGGVTSAITTERMRDLIVENNLYAFEVENSLANIQYSSVDWNNWECRYGISKEGLGVGTSTPVFELELTDPTGYNSAFVEVTAGSLLAGTGTANTHAGFQICWHNWIPTISPPNFNYQSGTGTPPATITVTAAKSSNKARFTIGINSLSPNSFIDCLVRVCSTSTKFNPL